MLSGLNLLQVETIRRVIPRVLMQWLAAVDLVASLLKLGPAVKLLALSCFLARAVRFQERLRFGLQRGEKQILLAELHGFSYECVARLFCLLSKFEARLQVH